MGAPGTGVFDAELLNPPDGTPDPAWDARRRILGVPTSTDKATKPGSSAQPVGSSQPPTAKGPRFDDWMTKNPNFGPNVEGNGEWFQSLGTVVVQAINSSTDAIVDAIHKLGGPLGSASSPSATGTSTGSGSSSAPSTDPLADKANVDRYWGKGTSGTFIVPRSDTGSSSKPKAAGMLSDRFPEPVVPYPGKEGIWWYGVQTENVYDNDGKVVQYGRGLKPGDVGPGPITPGSKTNTGPGGPPATYPWGLDPAGGPQTQTPETWKPDTTRGPWPGGPQPPVTLKLQLGVEGSAAGLVELITADPAAVEALTAAGWQLMIEEYRA